MRYRTILELICDAFSDTETYTYMNDYMYGREDYGISLEKHRYDSE